jgi:hypothetical protein
MRWVNEVLLVPVTDRGAVYQPPTTHLGKGFGRPSSIIVAELTVAYLESILSEAQTKFFS